jgi:acyl-CoA synthetase (NDP forming)
MVPASAVLAAVTECAQAGTSVCIVMSSGFAETGADGAKAQAELVRVARAHGMRLVGPNCIGAVGGPARVLATFSPVFSAASTPIPAGNVALVSQSGALGFGALSLGIERGVPIGIAVTTGNEADVTAVDVAARLVDDPSIDAVLMYIESLGEISALAKAAAVKPIAVIKAGRSEAGAKAAASHTGALASADKVVDSALRQAGIARVADIDALLDAGALFATGARMLGKRIGIVTTSGGSGILAADAIEACRMQLAELEPATIADLSAVVPSYGNATNPVDVTAAVLAADPGVDAIVACFAVLVGADVTRIARALGAVRTRTGLPVLAVRTGAASLAPEGTAVLAANGVPVYPTPERAVAALQALHATSQRRTRVIPAGSIAQVPEVGASEKQVKQILAAAGLPVPESVLVSSASDAVNAISQVGGLAVCKAIVPGLLHKSDAGGVVLGVTEKNAVDVFTRLEALGGQVLVERFVQGGVEAIVGVTPSALGPVLTIGVGGVLTEIVADAAVRLLPVDEFDVREMIAETALALMLAGARGAAPSDLEAFVRMVLQLASCTREWPTGFELDLNPVAVLDDGCWILDAMYADALDVNSLQQVEGR